MAPSAEKKKKRCKTSKMAFTIFQSSSLVCSGYRKGALRLYLPFWALRPFARQQVLIRHADEKQTSVLARRSADRSWPGPRQFVLSGATEELSLQPDTSAGREKAQPSKPCNASLPGPFHRHFSGKKRLAGRVPDGETRCCAECDTSRDRARRSTLGISNGPLLSACANVT